MDAIIFNGRFETENLQVFIDKLKEILSETDTTFYGHVNSYEMPKYVDYEEVKSDGESTSQSEETQDKSDSDTTI